MKITILEERKFSISRIGINLKKKGFSIEYFFDFEEFKNDYLLESDVYIIDMSSSVKNGFNILKWIKSKNIKSMIFLVFGELNYNCIINGFELGIDDCLVKPFNNEELIARIGALIRRKYNIRSNIINVYDELRYDSINKVFINNENIINLTSKEVQLAEYLVYNIGKLITKSQLINSVWGEYDILSVTDNNINVTISNLRKKLGGGFKLKTIVNRGYVLER